MALRRASAAPPAVPGQGWLSAALGEAKEGEIHEALVHDTRANAETRFLSELLLATEDNIMEVLRQRFVNQTIYTYGALGSLIAINPFRTVPCLADPEIALSRFKVDLTEQEMEGSSISGEPHVWAVCRDAWACQCRTERNVSFIIQGESGAGKTETAKHVLLYFSSGQAPQKPGVGPGNLAVFMQYANSRGGKRTRRLSLTQNPTGRLATGPNQDTGAKATVQQILMCANPLTEALGNAKTPRNDNSSRFGKFVKLFMSPEGQILSSEISIYSLEKSRIVLQGEGERNFHIFYQLLAGMSSEQKAKHRLRAKPVDYAMLTGGNCLTVPGMNDAHEWQFDNGPNGMTGFLPSLKVFEPSEETQAALFDLLSATLLCGEVKWSPEGVKPGNDNASCHSPSEMEDISILTGLDYHKLQEALSTRFRKLPGNPVPVKCVLTATQAVEQTQSLARCLYEVVFNWIVTLINKTCKGEQDGVPDLKWIGVLDIFGFEAYPKSAPPGSAHPPPPNSLEQLFINYCNERLHQFFIFHVFEQEKRVCSQEGFELDFDFQDNKTILEAIDSTEQSKGLGILTLLEEQCQLQTGTNEAFTTSCHARFKKTPNGCYVEPRIAPREHFEIRHSCCSEKTLPTVLYKTTAFRERNMDVMSPDLLQLLRGSTSSFIRELFPEPAVPAPETKGQKRGFLASQLLRSVGQLFELLSSSEPRFVKCVKSNPKKEQLVFDDDTVRAQLTTLSIVEALQTEKQGFTYKKPFKEFLEEHSALCVIAFGCCPGTSPWEDKETQMRVANPGKDVHQLLSVQLLQAIGTPPSAGGTTTADFQIGRTKVLMRGAMHQRCELMRLKGSSKARAVASELQKIIRAKLVSDSFQKQTIGIVPMQARLRRFLLLREQVRRKLRHARLMGAWRAAGNFRRLLLQIIRDKVKRRRRYLRGRFKGATVALRMLVRTKHRINMATKIQALFRGWRARRVVIPAKQREFHFKQLAKYQQRASTLFRSVLQRRSARIELLKLRALDSVKVIKTIMSIWRARGYLFNSRAEGAARMIQRCYRGMIGRREARRRLNIRHVEASKELKAHLEAMRARLKFAEFRRSEGFNMAGKALLQTRSMNHLLGFKSRYQQPRNPTPNSSGTAVQQAAKQQAAALRRARGDYSPAALSEFRDTKRPGQTANGNQRLVASKSSSASSRTVQGAPPAVPASSSSAGEKTPTRPASQPAAKTQGSNRGAVQTPTRGTRTPVTPKPDSTSRSSPEYASAGIGAATREQSPWTRLTSPRPPSDTRSTPAQLNRWLTRAKQEANAMYNSGALHSIKAHLSTSYSAGAVKDLLPEGVAVVALGPRPGSPRRDGYASQGGASSPGMPGMMRGDAPRSPAQSSHSLQRSPRSRPQLHADPVSIPNDLREALLNAQEIIGEAVVTVRQGGARPRSMSPQQSMRQASPRSGSPPRQGDSSHFPEGITYTRHAAASPRIVVRGATDPQRGAPAAKGAGALCFERMTGRDGYRPAAPTF